ncbi:MAG: transcriptional repressor LexA [Firmicutes bacterium]|nr:transcriptional repressor LexA [Bacillota bacterium]
MARGKEVFELPGGKGKITGRQKQVLDFIRHTIDMRGYPPTVRDIASHLSIISLNAVRVHLSALEKKGYISVEANTSRGIRLLLEENPQIPSSVIPLVGKIAAGPLSAAIEDREGGMVMDQEFWGSTDELFLLRVKGDSMEPHIHPGDLVVVRRQQNADPGDIVAALIEDEATVKQLVKSGGKLRLHAFNPAYQDIEIGDNFKINGKVTGLIRKFH